MNWRSHVRQGSGGAEPPQGISGRVWGAEPPRYCIGAKCVNNYFRPKLTFFINFKDLAIPNPPLSLAHFFQSLNH